MKTFYRILDWCFPMLMNFIWGTVFFLQCKREGYAVFGTGEKGKRDALDSLVKPL